MAKKNCKIYLDYFTNKLHNRTRIFKLHCMHNYVV